MGGVRRGFLLVCPHDVRFGTYKRGNLRVFDVEKENPKLGKFEVGC